jgi:hypothetical protein
MGWMLPAAILAAGTLAIFTDWLFMGVLFHAHYNRYPEVWWPSLRQGDSRAIIASSVLDYVTAAALVVLCVRVHPGFVASRLGDCLAVAGLAWAAGPLVVAVTNGFWIRIDPRVTFAHALGYLVRFLLAGAAAAFVPR